MTDRLLAIVGMVLVSTLLGFAPGAGAQPADEDAEPDEDGEESAGEGTGSPAEAPPEAPEIDEISITRELKSVEQNVNVLKEKVFRSKARLYLLEEKVIKGVVAGAKAQLVHVNKLGSAYRIESITYFFDGTPIFEKVDAAADFQRKKELKIFEGNIPPGNHSITANIVVRGNGSGAFSYLDEYTFKGQESYSFIAEDNKTAVIRMVLQKKGGALGNFEEGPVMKFEQEDIANVPGADEG